MDSSTGKILYAKNPDLKCFPASTTKLMTAIVTIENKDLRDVVAISRNAALTPPHKAGFKEGDKVTVEKLLYAALIGSANDAAVALAEAVAGSEANFVELMNRKAAAIGATDTKFINPNGLPGPGQHITASDLAKIMNYALRYPKLREIIGTRVAEISTERGKAIFLRNTNRLLWSDEELVGGKTGFTQKARHCFVCAAERANDTVLVAVLGSPSRSDLWRESEILINRGFEVKANRENPAIYLAKAEDITDVERTSYQKVVRSKKGGKAVVKKMTRHQRVKMLAKKKGKTKSFAKSQSRKKYRVAKRSSVDRNKV
jgi:D-alanyl-D-alanine carboxypeptidase (penicillin-binding protein 5/6)